MKRPEETAHNQTLPPRVDRHDPDGPPLQKAIEFEPLPEMGAEERELGVFLAPFAVGKGRGLFSLEEIFIIFKEFLPPREELSSQLYAEQTLVSIGRDVDVPRLAYVAAGMLRYLHSEEAGDSIDFEGQQACLTLRGVLWFLRRYATVPYPHLRMEVPSELVYPLPARSRDRSGMNVDDAFQLPDLNAFKPHDRRLNSST